MARIIKKGHRGVLLTRTFVYDALGNTIIKQCVICKEVKMITEFFNRSTLPYSEKTNKREGYRNVYCKTCNVRDRKKWSLKNPLKRYKKKSIPININLIGQIIEAVKIQINI